MYTPKQIGEILSSQQQKKLDDERPKKATVVATGSGLTNRGTTGQIRAELSNGTTIWVDAGGNLAELTAGDIIYVERIGVGKRSEWRMVDWFSDSLGNRVPAGRSDVLFNAKVSEIWAADGDPIALDTDDDGNMEVLTSLDMGGTQLVLDADGDTSITADTDDQIDIEVGGYDIGTITAVGMSLIAGRDYAARGDTYPLMDRLVDHQTSPEEHFTTDYGDLDAWAGAPFATPSTSAFGTPSFAQIYDSSNGTRAFRYDTVSLASGTALDISCRVFCGPFVSLAGIRFDDGSDDNYVDMGLRTNGITNGLAALVSRYDVGAAGATETVYLSGSLPSGQIHEVRIYRTTGDTVYVYHRIDGVNWSYLGAVGSGGAFNFTITRIGIAYTIATAGSTDRAGFFDWFRDGQ